MSKFAGWNFQQGPFCEIHVCRGLHERGQKCEYDPLMVEEAEAMSSLIKKQDHDLFAARQIITDLLEYAEQNDPGCPHIGRAKGFLSGGES